MSVLDYGLPMSRNFGPFSSDLGSFWGPGSPDYPLQSPSALEAQGLSSFFPGDTTDIFHGSAGGGQPRGRREGGRSKRKMSSREEPPEEHPPKRRRETESYPQHQQQQQHHQEQPPQYVAPHELVTSPSEMPQYQPLPSPREPTAFRRQVSGGPGHDQGRPIEPAHSYSQSQYLQPPPESEWPRSMQGQSGERPVLPSLQTTAAFSSSPHLDRRPSASYSAPATHAGYAPVSAATPYDRHASYSYASVGYDSHPRYDSSRGSSHSPLPSSAEQAQQDSDGRSKPRCWEHGCKGRVFSTFSNLLRHQRERAGTSAKSYCPRCGAEFTRTTAMKGHLAHAKCKPRRSPDPPSSAAGQQ